LILRFLQWRLAPLIEELLAPPQNEVPFPQEEEEPAEEVPEPITPPLWKGWEKRQQGQVRIIAEGAENSTVNPSFAFEAPLGIIGFRFSSRNFNVRS
jgi:hypothetical protein